MPKTIREVLIQVYGYGRFDESQPTRTLKDSLPNLDQAEAEIKSIRLAELISEEEIGKILLDTKNYWDGLSDCGKVSLPVAGVKLYAKAIKDKMTERIK